MTVASPSARGGSPATLRERQVAVAWWDYDGDIAAIAADLGISRNTVLAHLANLRARTNTKRTLTAVRALLAA